jgi:hypothetical protein
VADLELDPAALAALEKLYATDAGAADVVDDWLDALEADPGQARVRRRRLRPPGLWYIPFRLTATGDWMILWELEGDVVVVRYLGPNLL